MCGEFLYQLSNCWLLRNDFSSWNQHAALKTVGILGCDGEKVLELMCAERNAGNLSTWNCSVSVLCVCPDQYRIWLHSLAVFVHLISAHCCTVYKGYLSEILTLLHLTVG